MTGRAARSSCRRPDRSAAAAKCARTLGNRRRASSAGRRCARGAAAGCGGRRPCRRAGRASRARPTGGAARGRRAHGEALPRVVDVCRCSNTVYRTSARQTITPRSRSSGTPSTARGFQVARQSSAATDPRSPPPRAATSAGTANACGWTSAPTSACPSTRRRATRPPRAAPAARADAVRHPEHEPPRSGPCQDRHVRHVARPAERPAARGSRSFAWNRTTCRSSSLADDRDRAATPRLGVDEAVDAVVELLLPHARAGTRSSASRTRHLEAVAATGSTPMRRVSRSVPPPPRKNTSRYVPRARDERLERRACPAAACSARARCARRCRPAAARARAGPRRCAIPPARGRGRRSVRELLEPAGSGRRTRRGADAIGRLHAVAALQAERQQRRRPGRGRIASAASRRRSPRPRSAPTASGPSGAASHARQAAHTSSSVAGRMTAGSAASSRSAPGRCGSCRRRTARRRTRS